MPGALVATFRTAPSLAATADVSSLSGYGYGYGNVITDAPVTVTPTGGTPPYTHLWTNVSGSATVKVDQATSESTSFYALLNVAAVSAVWHDTVTDAIGATAVAGPVTIDLESYNYYDGS